MWPWLVMPLIVLLAFYALYRVHQRPVHPATPVEATPAENPGGG
jgi:hypothetical protein